MSEPQYIHQKQQEALLKLLSTTQLSIQQSSEGEKPTSLYDQVEEIAMMCAEIAQTNDISDKILAESSCEDSEIGEYADAKLVMENLKIIRDNLQKSNTIASTITKSVQEMFDRCSPTYIAKQEEKLADARKQLIETQGEIRKIIEARAIESKHNELGMKRILKNILYAHNEGVNAFDNKIKELDSIATQGNQINDRFKEKLEQLDLEFNTEINDLKNQIPYKVDKENKQNITKLANEIEEANQEPSIDLKSLNEEEKKALAIWDEGGGEREENADQKSCEWDEALENSSMISDGMKNYVEEKAKQYGDSDMDLTNKNLLKQLIENDYKREKNQTADQSNKSVPGIVNHTLELENNCQSMNLKQQPMKELNLSPVGMKEDAKELPNQEMSMPGNEKMSDLCNQQSDILSPIRTQTPIPEDDHSDIILSDNKLSEKLYPELPIPQEEVRMEYPVECVITTESHDDAIKVVENNSKSLSKPSSKVAVQLSNDNEELISEKSSTLNKNDDKSKLEIIKECNNEMSNSSILVSGRNIKVTKTARSTKSYADCEEKKNASLHNHHHSIESIKREEPTHINAIRVKQIVNDVSNINITAGSANKSIPELPTLSSKAEHSITIHCLSNEKSNEKIKRCIPKQGNKMMPFFYQSLINKNAIQSIKNNTLNSSIDPEYSSYLPLNTKQLLDCCLTKSVGLIFLSSQMTNFKSTTESFNKRSGFINLDRLKPPLVVKGKIAPKSQSKFSIKFCDDHGKINFPLQIRKKIASFKCKDHANMSLIESTKSFLKKEKAKLHPKANTDHINQSIN